MFILIKYVIIYDHKSHPRRFRIEMVFSGTMTEWCHVACCIVDHVFIVFGAGVLLTNAHVPILHIVHRPYMKMGIRCIGRRLIHITVLYLCVLDLLMLVTRDFNEYLCVLCEHS